MKVILLEDVIKVGRRGELRDVADGFARNYLVPRRLALAATPGNVRNLEQIRRQQEAKAGRAHAAAGALAARVEALHFTVARQASDEGKLFGSVTSQDIAEYLAAQGLDIERRRIQLGEPLKALGDAAVPVRIHAEVTAQLKVTVVRG